jgi:nucleotide-binding universal stress UspA family protein
MRRSRPASLLHPASPTRGDHVRRPTVLVGVDGSDGSWSAFAWACGEAARLHGRAIAVYVSATTARSLSAGAAVAGFDAAGYAAEVGRSHDERAAALAAEVADRAAGLGIEVTFRHVHGEVADQLTAVAREAQADAIAVGRPTRPLRRLFGSVGRRLMRRREMPIVVIVP